MHDPDWAEDLEPTAHRLNELAWPDPAPGLRDRVLQAVSRAHLPVAARPRWAYVAGLAAAVLLVLNFTLVVANHRACLPVPPGSSRRERVERIQELLPELSPAEARALAY
ncbi:MAG: hypothetical protein AB7K24_04435 [Gemmataceae bacterium]